MDVKLPSRSDLLWLLASGLPPPGPFPISSTELNPGLFGPGTVTWRVMREPMLLLGASRALLMQVAHPLVAQGALDHSDFTADPVGRFQRTVAWVTSVVFGTEDEALAATREVNRLHRKVEGTLPADHATARWSAGAAYQARDRDLLLWVHGTLVDSMLDTHDKMIGGLSQRQRDRFVREWDAVVKIMGIAEGTGWRGVADMRGWIASQIESGVALPGAGSRSVADVILVPRLGMRGPRGLAELTGFITAGLLPEVIRRHYRIRWSPAHEVAHQGLRVSLRSTKAVFPRPMRVSPVYEFAVARTAGELHKRPALLQQLVRQPRLA
ncbi:MAG: oxygenase MpaB family protein [Candidatus Dormibacteria bacterium]